MTNQQLLDFIKSQLALGLTKEKISSELLANGWNTQDIEEGFKAVVPVVFNPSGIPIPPIQPNISTPSSYNNALSTTKLVTHSGRKVFFIVLILFLLAGGASAYYFRNNLMNLSIVKSILTKQQVAPIAQNNTETLPTTVVTPSTVSPLENETASWTPYKNEEYGFEIKYPPQYSASEKNNNKPSLLFENSLSLTLTSSDQNNPSKISVDAREASMKDMINLFIENGVLIKQEEQKIGDNTFTYIEVSTKDTKNQGALPSQGLLIEHNGFLYSIEISKMPLSEVEKNILSTLSFIEITPKKVQSFVVSQPKIIPSDAEIKSCSSSPLGVANCLSLIAVKRKDPSVCAANEQPVYERDDCYGFVAPQIKDANVCNYINNGLLRDSCYRDTAIAIGDIKLCENIYNASIKNMCQTKVNK